MSQRLGITVSTHQVLGNLFQLFFLTILNLLYRYLFKLQMLMQLRILASLLTKHLSFFLI